MEVTANLRTRTHTKSNPDLMYVGLRVCVHRNGACARGYSRTSTSTFPKMEQNKVGSMGCVGAADCCPGQGPRVQVMKIAIVFRSDREMKILTRPRRFYTIRTFTIIYIYSPTDIHHSPMDVRPSICQGCTKATARKVSPLQCPSSWFASTPRRSHRHVCACHVVTCRPCCHVVSRAEHSIPPIVHRYISAARTC